MEVPQVIHSTGIFHEINHPTLAWGTPFVETPASIKSCASLFCEGTWEDLGTPNHHPQHRSHTGRMPYLTQCRGSLDDLCGETPAAINLPWLGMAYI